MVALSEASVDLEKTVESVVFGGQRLTIEDVVAVATGSNVALSDDVGFLSRIHKGAEFLERLWREEGVVYGVTTGYGDSCTVSVPPHLVHELPIHLIRFHGCGMGRYLSHDMGRAVLATRLASLSQGYSGVTMGLLEQILTLINRDIVPLIPEEGSVGASGDLTPLSYVAAVLMGEREVLYQGAEHSTAELYKILGIEPISLQPKEGLALMNGTSVMTALACLAYSRAEYLTRLVSRITSMVVLAIKGNANHFDDLLFAVKPHPGQIQIADWIREDLNWHEHPRNSNRLQDRYSLRCAPHVIGVLKDALPMFRQMIENELNSANDNPIIDGEGEHVLHGGHFYGGHIAFVMDSMKNCIANLADLMDRQLALLVDSKYNNGLPPNLTGASPDRIMINHGFKAVQVGASAWTAEALKQTMPASVFSRSTECHNQDKVSMGTIAARDCLRVLELTEQVAAASLLAATQGMELRERQGEVDTDTLSSAIIKMKQEVLAYFDIVEEDRPLETVLRQTTEMIRQHHWELYR